MHRGERPLERPGVEIKSLIKADETPLGVQCSAVEKGVEKRDGYIAATRDLFMMMVHLEIRGSWRVDPG